MSLYLGRIGYSLGEVSRTVDEAARLGLLLSPPAALREAGFHQHHASERSAYDLARRAVDAIGDRLSDVGAIVYSTCLPLNGSVGRETAFRTTRDVKHLMDFPASHLQADFGLENATVIGLSQQACTGMLGSLRLARGLLAAEPELTSVLCLTADRFPDGALYEQSYNLISDGAAACVVSRREDEFRLLAVHGLTNGALARASDDETAGSFFAWSHRTISETLARAGITMADVTLFVAQNMNRKALEILARLLRYDPERVVSPTIGEVGHVISGDNLINLAQLSRSGRLRPGDRLLLFMAGYGLNWQCVVLEKTQ